MKQTKKQKSIKQAIQLVFNGHLISTNFTFYRQKEYARTENNQYLVILRESKKDSDKTLKCRDPRDLSESLWVNLAGPSETI